MVPPSHPVTAWWFRGAVLVAAAPLLAAVTVTAVVFQDDDTVRSLNGTVPGEPLRLLDRWHATQTFGQSGWPAVLTAVACVALAFAAVSGRPRHLAPPESRLVLTGLALVCGAWALGTTTLTAWFQVTHPRGVASAGYELLLPQWALDTGQGLFAVVVAGAAVLWCRRSPSEGSDEGDLEDVGVPARAE